MENKNFEKAFKEYQISGSIERKNWFQENIAGLIAMSFTIFTFAVYIIILCRVVRTTETTTTVILTSITNMEMIILGFYFVSSKSNKDKDKIISEMQNINTEVKTEIESKKDEKNPV